MIRAFLGKCRQRNVLLLTSTVQPPPDARSLARTDPHLRLADYMSAFEFYLGILRSDALDGIVFAENSGFDVSCFKARATRFGLQDKVDCMSHFGLDYPGRYGRGYGEFRLVDHAMEHSPLVALAGPGLVVWKVTGRYIVRNIAELVRSRPTDADLYCHFHNLPRAYVDLHVMAWTRTGYSEIVRGASKTLRQDHTPRSAEKRFRELLDNGAFDARIVRRFGKVPRVDGVRAGDNRSFGQLRMKYHLRVLAQRWIPNVWI